jgi:hypothetical protein
MRGLDSLTVGENVAFIRMVALIVEIILQPPTDPNQANSEGNREHENWQEFQRAN